LVPMIGLAGAAIDYSRASAARTAMQASLDATTLMIAKDAQLIASDQVGARATQLFNAGFGRDDVQSIQVNAVVSSGTAGTTVTATAGGAVPTTFMHVLGQSTMNIAAHASVVSATDGLGCVLSLNSSASGAATAQGSTTVKLNGCSLYDNSANSSALTVGGSATVAADFIGVVGGIGSSTGITTVNGSGVTLCFTASSGRSWAGVTSNGNANVNLTPMTYGPTRGIVVFADRNTPQGTSFKFNGGSNQYFAGAIYVPTGAVNFAGGADTATTCTQVIGDTVTFVGNSNLAIDCSRYNTRPFSSKTMRVAS